MQFSKNNKISIAMSVTTGASGTSDAEGVILDMSGFEGVCFIVTMGAITSGAVTGLTVQQDSDVAGGTMTNLEGTGQTVADTDDEKVFYLDIYKPAERYVRLHCDRATQAAVLSAVAIQYGASKLPVTHGTNVSGEAHVSPAEGTA